MINLLTVSGTDYSPWPPVLVHTPETTKGIEAAAALAFGPHWDTPMSELTPEEILNDILKYTPEFAQELLGMAE